MAEPPLPILILPKLSRKSGAEPLTSTIPKGIPMIEQIPVALVVQE